MVAVEEKHVKQSRISTICLLLIGHWNHVTMCAVEDESVCAQPGTQPLIIH